MDCAVLYVVGKHCVLCYREDVVGCSISGCTDVFGPKEKGVAGDW